MTQTPAQTLAEFTQKLNSLKNKSLQLIDVYHNNCEKVKQHLIICRLKHQPVDLKIIASYPKAEVFIRQVSHIQKEIISLRNDYLKLLKVYQ